MLGRPGSIGFSNRRDSFRVNNGNVTLEPSAPAGTKRFLRDRWVADREADRRLVGILLAACGSTATAQIPPEPPVLTLGDVVMQALAANRTVASAALDVARAEEKLASAKSRRWPTLSVSALASRLLTRIDFEFEKGAFGDFPGTGPIPAEDTKVGTSQGFSILGIGQLQFPLLQQYEIGLNVRLNSASAEAAREQLRSRRRRPWTRCGAPTTASSRPRARSPPPRSRSATRGRSSG